MLKPLQDNIARHRLCKATDKILLAVSGGVDSMVMMDLFHKSGYKIGVAHCNFKLRGQESDEDEFLVKQVCNRLSIPFFSTHMDTNNYAAAQGISIQMAARELRYAWFGELLLQHGFDLLATAHHLNDSVETILLNLTNGRGVDGLTGIAAKNKQVIRPLLFALRQDIQEYATNETVVWRNDKSNDKTTYARNRVRHEVIPPLKHINPNLERTVQRAIEKNQGILELMKMGIAVFESKHVARSEERMTIRKEALSGLEYPSAVLYELIKSFQFLPEQCNSIVDSLPGQPGKKFLSPGYVLVIDRIDLIISKNQSPSEEIMITEGKSRAVSGRWQLNLTLLDQVVVFNEPDRIVLDADSVRYPIIWRPWHAGDSFEPLGMDHQKKISDFLIDRKVARPDKDRVMVLESDGEIVWVVGYQISNRFKITKDTKRAISISLSPYFM